MNKGGKFNNEDDGDDEEGANWQDSYSDLVTDLLAIFVVLFAFAMMQQAYSNAAKSATNDAVVIMEQQGSSPSVGNDGVLDGVDSLFPEQNSFISGEEQAQGESGQEQQANGAQGENSGQNADASQGANADQSANANQGENANQNANAQGANADQSANSQGANADQSASAQGANANQNANAQGANANQNANAQGANANQNANAQGANANQNANAQGTNVNQNANAQGANANQNANAQGANSNQKANAQGANGSQNANQGINGNQSANAQGANGKQNANQGINGNQNANAQGANADQGANENVEDFLDSTDLYVGDSEYEDQISVSRQGSNEVLLRINGSILFDLGKAKVSPNAESTLSKVNDILTANEDSISMVRVEGHTDNIPINSLEFESNWELSTFRAVNVVKWLLKNSTLSEELFSAVGYGEYHPIADNDSSKGRARNRRVDFIIELKSEETQ